MWIILDLATMTVHSPSFQRKEEAEAWWVESHQPGWREAFYVHIPEVRGPDVPAARVNVASKLKKLADKSGGYDVLQSALEYLRA